MDMLKPSQMLWFETAKVTLVPSILPSWLVFPWFRKLFENVFWQWCSCTGYSMTELCGMCAILPSKLMHYSAVGLPVPSIDIKFPDASYLSSNEVQQGEICIHGPSVVKGYYKYDDLNNDESIFTKDRWLRTGDIGQWNPDGTLSVIDR